ncbi:MAG: PaaI family thioesterase [Rubrivivax sp.]|nr:PaaI family thioesterase [Rubrivivax sp.]
MSTVPPEEVPFLADLGLALADDGDTLQLVLQPRHLNRRGVAHGGLLMTLLDAALTRAARHADTADHAVATVELKTSFLQPGRGTLLARGHCVHRSGTLAFCEATVNDTEGHPVARASATLRYLRGAAPDTP